MTISQLILHTMSYSSYYELFILRTKLLTRFSKTFKHTSSPFHTPVMLPREERSYTSYNNVSEAFIKPTVVRNTILRAELPQKSRLFFLQLNFISGHSGDDFLIHSQNRSMFMSSDNPSVSPFINVQKFFKKWVHTYDFLLNLFFSRTCVLMFAPKAMKEEAIAFNWSYGLIPYNLFRYASPFFFMKNVPFGGDSPLAYNRLAYTGIGVAFVADVNYHQGSLFHLKTTGFFVVGLVSSNMNPWLVHYTIYAGSNTLLTQYFFIRLMAYFRQQAEYLRFKSSRSLWLR